MNKVSCKKQHHDFPGEVSTACSTVGLYFAAVRVCHSTALPDLITSEDGVEDCLGVNELNVGIVEQVVDAAAQVAPDALQCCATLCSAGAIAGAVRLGQICQVQNEVAVGQELLYAPHPFLRDAASVVQIFSHLLTAVCVVVIGKSLHGGTPALNLVAPLEVLVEAAVPGGLRLWEFCQSRWRTVLPWSIDATHSPEGIIEQPLIFSRSYSRGVDDFVDAAANVVFQYFEVLATLI